MGLRDTITRFVVTRLLERPAAKTGYAGLTTTLTNHQKSIEAHATAKADSPRNRAVLSHIIGIERWGQNRLKEALGNAYVQEEYNGYRPAKTATREELLKTFRATRAETLKIAGQLNRAKPTRAPGAHNSFGQLTTLGWLRYLDIHATMESKKIW